MYRNAKPVAPGSDNLPALRRGDRATYLYRDGDVVITGWSNARISWPRCRRLDTRRGGSGLLVDEELARAIRIESSLAIQHWWGVGMTAVWAWRKALGVGRFNEGSAKLRKRVNARTAQKLTGRRLPPAQVERRRQTAKALGLRPKPSYTGGRPWTAEELALLGTVPDGELAAQIGRTETAVRVRRAKRGIPRVEGQQPLAERKRQYRPELTLEQIGTWALAHQRRTGKWPTARSGPVEDAPGETWRAIEMALVQGHRGLLKGLSIARVLKPLKEKSP